MALSPTGEGYVAASGADEAADALPPMFDVQRVQLQFQLAAEFVAAQVANNVLILALATGRILRIDLDNAEDIDGNVASLKTDSKLTEDRYRLAQKSF